MNPPKIVIIGRPNVGKSSIFNRLVGNRKALVHDMPGVTRDRNLAETDWHLGPDSYHLQIVDTGGVGGDKYDEEICHQVAIAVSEADLVLMTFDGRAGLLPQDSEVLRLYQRESVRKVPIIGVVNKVDTPHMEDGITEFYAAGLDELHLVSAEHNRGFDDLKLDIVKKLPEADAEEAKEEVIEERYPRIAIVGQPNVGKSTMLNTLLGMKRAVTSPIAGTTVDTIDAIVELDGHKFKIVDTAGIRRKSKTKQGVEVLSVVQARKALEKADIAILVMDAERGIADQDEKIGGLIEDAGCSVIIVMNKWDLHRKTGFKQEEAVKHIRKDMGYLHYAPILFTSAIKGKGFKHLGDLLNDILEQRRRDITTADFNSLVRRQIEIHNPKNAKIYFAHQVGKNPPSFGLHVNDPKKISFSTHRLLVNSIREEWGYMGSPIRLKIQKSNRGFVTRSTSKL